MESNERMVNVNNNPDKCKNGVCNSRSVVINVGVRNESGNNRTGNWQRTYNNVRYGGGMGMGESPNVGKVWYK